MLVEMNRTKRSQRSPISSSLFKILLHSPENMTSTILKLSIELFIDI